MNLCQVLCLSRSNRHEIRSEVAKIDLKGCPTFKFSIWTLYVLLYDNLGFTKGGAGPRYVHWVNMAWQAFTYKKLLQIGALDACARPRSFNLRFSTIDSLLKVVVPQDFDQATSKYVQAKIGGEYSLVTRRTAHNLDEALCVVDAASDIMIQSYCSVQGEEQYTLADFTRAFEVVHVFDQTLPHRQTGGPDGVITTVTVEVEVDLLDHDEFEEETRGSADEGAEESKVVDESDLYARNNFSVVEPMNSDLNKTATVVALNDYVVRKHNDLAMQRADSDDGPADLTMAQVVNLYAILGTVYTQADGPPFSSTIRLQLEEPNRTRWNTLASKAGPFHVVLELCKLSGAICGPLFLSSLIHSKRSSPGAQRWFLEPGDPSQHLNEGREYLFAAYVSATIEYIVYTEEQTNEPVADVTWHDVHAYMLERAREHPLVFMIILWMRIMDIELALLDCEALGEAAFEDYQLFFKLTQLLNAVGNATKYVRGGAHTLVEWETQSEASTLVEKYLLFTKKTQHGSNIFPDRAMEWINHDLRKFCGKSWYKGKEAKVIRTALLMPEKVKNRERAATCIATTGQAERATYEVAGNDHHPKCTDVFVHGLYWFAKHKIFTRGSVPIDNKKNPLPAGKLAHPDDGAILNPACVATLFIASQRLEENAHRWEFGESRGAVKRPGEGSLFAKIVPTEAGLDDKYKFHVDRASTTDPVIIEKQKRGRTLLFNNKALIAELKRLHDAGVENAPSPEELKKLIKVPINPRLKLSQAVALARAEYFKEHPPEVPAQAAECSLEHYPKMQRGTASSDVVEHPLISLVGSAMPTLRTHFVRATPAPAPAANPDTDPPYLTPMSLHEPGSFTHGIYSGFDLRF